VLTFESNDNRKDLDQQALAWLIWKFNAIEVLKVTVPLTLHGLENFLDGIHRKGKHCMGFSRGRVLRTSILLSRNSTSKKNNCKLVPVIISYQ